ncbi:MAG: HNH endonuclease [Eggerthellaceae bacterium]
MSGDVRTSSEWRRLSKQCFERDKSRNAPCHICLQSIDYSLAQSSCPDAYEADHLRPVDKHPELALLPENVAASHVRCNRSRKNKATINALGNQSRNWNV